MNVLVTAVGTGIGLSIIKSLRLAKRAYWIVGVDSNAFASGLYRCDCGYIIPEAKHMDYADELKKIIKKEKIDIIIPGSDHELQMLTVLEDYLDTRILSPPLDAVILCRDKYLCNKFLDRHGFHARIPTELLVDVESLLAVVDYPILVKPRYGSGTNNVQVLFNDRELDLYRIRTGEAPYMYIAQEYISEKLNPKRKDVYRHGRLIQTDEFSTEVLVSKNKEVLGSVTNWRTMKKGIPFNVVVKDYPEINEVAISIVEWLIREYDYIGPCNIQSKYGSIFEINPRFSGSTVIRSVAGFNGPNVLVQSFVYNVSDEMLKRQLSVNELVETKYLDEIYLSPQEFSEVLKTKFVQNVGKRYEY